MSVQTLKGKAAVVTGGTRGIGYAIAKALVEEGADVLICGTRQQTVDSALARLPPMGRATGVVADVSKLDHVQRMMATAKETFGGIDILINNAGVGYFATVENLKTEQFERMLAINLTGLFYCSREAVAIMRERGGGDVVNISSLAGINPFMLGAGYNATKFAVNGFSEAMMLDHRYDGLRVSYVMPGSVDTEFGGPAGGADWKISADDVADATLAVLKMPRRTTISRIEIRPSMPPRKRS
jgi:NAD(P)-dependent dehydrogenase (short-subunit alcohol dehydrogenase family)